jgi:plasmid maintenance system antidote protein VapI
MAKRFAIHPGDILQNEYDLRTVEVVGLAEIRPYKAA